MQYFTGGKILITHRKKITNPSNLYFNPKKPTYDNNLPVRRFLLLTFALVNQQSTANLPFSAARWPFFYGWMILVWGTLGMLMSVPGQTIGVSVFTEPLLEVLKLSRDQLSLAYMAGTISSAFLLPWAGQLYDRWGVRPVASLAALLLGLVLAYLSQVDRVVRWLDATPSITLTLLSLFLGFLSLRFLGQGVLTLVSRNMMMQWFDQRRGFATGFSNVFISLGFSSAPVVLDSLIQQYDWREAWLILGATVGLLFPVVVLVFFRNTPEASGLCPDGSRQSGRLQPRFRIVKDFTRREALRSYAFWLFTLMLAMQGLYVTGFTFHVISIFELAGLGKVAAITIFQPVAVLAVIVTLTASSLSDYIPLKYLLYAEGLGACLGIIGMIYLGESWAYYSLVAGNGLMMGLFSVITTVTWPRYFGKRYLGAVSGQATMFIVFGSALGPVLFSASLSNTGDYGVAGWVCCAIFFTLVLGATRADNPQVLLEKRETTTRSYS